MLKFPRIDLLLPAYVHPKQSPRVAPLMRDGEPVLDETTHRPKLIPYTETKQRQNERLLMSLLVEHRPEQPWEGPVLLWVDVEYPWLKSHPKWMRDLLFAWKDTRPDDDNLRKQVGDVLTKLGYYRDDGQIANGSTIKIYTGYQQCRLRIELLPTARQMRSMGAAEQKQYQLAFIKQRSREPLFLCGHEPKKGVAV